MTKFDSVIFDSEGWPTLDGLRTALASWRGKAAYIIPMTSETGSALGNNGDFLMHWVFRRVLDELEIRTTNGYLEADLAIVPPNGAMLEIYEFPKLLARRLEPLKSLPLVIFPSSALFPTRSPAFIFEGRTAPTTWMFREAFSLQHITTRWGDDLQDCGVELLLDHDIVASGHLYVRELFESRVHSRMRRNQVLIAARLDVERVRLDTRPSSPSAVKNSLRGWFKRELRLILAGIPHARARTFLARTARQRSMRHAGNKLLSSVKLDNASCVTGARKAVWVDASAVEYATFGEYLRFLHESDSVVTDRLHVALPAAILGRSVTVVEAGYHKLEGVYLQSLTRVPNIVLLKPVKGTH